MTGNVWEFADDLKTPSEQAVRSFAAILKPHDRHEPWYVIRGGSYKRPLTDGVVYEWTSVPARFSAPTSVSLREERGVRGSRFGFSQVR